jgi:hypothetical protein
MPDLALDNVLDCHSVCIFDRNIQVRHSWGLLAAIDQVFRNIPSIPFLGDFFPSALSPSKVVCRPSDIPI